MCCASFSEYVQYLKENKEEKSMHVQLEVITQIDSIRKLFWNLCQSMVMSGSIWSGSFIGTLKNQLFFDYSF